MVWPIIVPISCYYYNDDDGNDSIVDDIVFIVVHNVVPVVHNNHYRIIVIVTLSHNHLFWPNHCLLSHYHTVPLNDHFVFFFSIRRGPPVIFTSPVRINFCCPVYVLTPVFSCPHFNLPGIYLLIVVPPDSIVVRRRWPLNGKTLWRATAHTPPYFFFLFFFLFLFFFFFFFYTIQFL